MGRYKAKTKNNIRKDGKIEVKTKTKNNIRKDGQRTRKEKKKTQRIT